MHKRIKEEDVAKIGKINIHTEIVIPNIFPILFFILKYLAYIIIPIVPM